MSEFARRSGDSDVLSKDRLLRAAKDAFSSLYSAGRRPVAFTGSGLSLIYGGLTWDDAVAEILTDTLAELESLIEHDGSATGSIRRRHYEMLKVYEAGLGLDSSTGDPGDDRKLSYQDKMVVLSLCDDARKEIRSVRDVPTANEFLANLVRDDTLATEVKLADRFKGYDAALKGSDSSDKKRWNNRRAARKRAIQSILTGKEGEPDASKQTERDAAVAPSKGLDEFETSKGKEVQAKAPSVSSFAARAYSLDGLKSVLTTLGEQAKEEKHPLHEAIQHAQKIVDTLREEMIAAGIKNQDVLPVDRRSSLAPFLALLPQSGREKIAKDIRNQFGAGDKPAVVPPRRPLTDPLRLLGERMLIERFMTLNYDWELERLLMFPDYQANFGPKGIEDTLKESPGVIEREKGGALTRRMPDGRYVASEVYEPNAAARIFEFALNSPDHGAHILHLHGRADKPADMVAGDQDYQRIYLREASDPRALERGLDVALTGSPILFVGTALSEAEITRAFRHVVAEGRVTPDRPAFALLAHNYEERDRGPEAWREQAAFYQRLGIHILHYGHPYRGRDENLSEHVALIKNLVACVEGGAGKLSDIDPSEYAILREDMPTDLAILQFCIKLTKVLSNSENWNTLFPADQLEPPESLEVRVATAKSGMIDYLRRLKVRVISQALAREISELAKETWKAARASEQQLEPREGADRSSMAMNALWLRHISAEPEPSDEPSASETDASPAQERADLGSKNARKEQWLNGEATAPFDLEELLPLHRFALVIASSQAGKGAIVRRLIHLLESKEICEELKRPTLIINFTFAVEVDGAVAQIYKFLANCELVGWPPTDRLNRIEKALEAAKERDQPAQLDQPACRIVFTGLDRLFDRKGACIAPDLDRLLRSFVLAGNRSPISLTLIGTEVLDLWLKGVTDQLLEAARLKAEMDQLLETQLLETSPPSKSQKAELPSPVRFRLQPIVEASNKRGLTGIGETFRSKLEKAKSRHVEGAISIRTEVALAQDGVERQTQMLLQIILDFWSEIAPEGGPNLGRDAACRLDLLILRFLSLVTAPVEAPIIRHVPDIRQLLIEAGMDASQQVETIGASLKRLRLFGLVKCVVEECVRLPGDQWGASAYTLHRVVLREMRERLGVPMGDALLSNTFTPTLASSLPVDVSFPDDDIQNEMMQILSHLRGAWKDKPSDTIVGDAIKAIRDCLPPQTNPHLSSQWRGQAAASRLTRFVAMTGTDMQESLNASCNIIRSFFSATTLVMLPAEGVRASRPWRTPFDDHKRTIRKTFVTLHEVEKLKTLCEKRRSRNGISEKDELDESLADIASAWKAVPPDKFKQEGGARYIEESVEGLKEVQTKHLDPVLERYPPAGRRPPLYGGELVWLHNERAVISLIQGDLYEAGYSFARAVAANKYYKGDVPGNNINRINLNRSLWLIERGRLEEARAQLHAILHDLPDRVDREQKLLTPLAKGYLGLIAHLNGRAEDAENHYDESIKGLVATEQLRALSLFHMRRASLLSTLADAEDAIRYAEACRQADVLWRARLLRAEIHKESTDRDHVGQEAFKAAESLGLVRVSVEALMTRAGAALRGKNLELAADLTTKAMAIASRYGMTLRRISLRVRMGDIMLRKRNQNGEWLLRRAIAHADRIGYQSCVQKAQEALLKSG